jgi:hypothetical protein
VCIGNAEMLRGNTANRVSGAGSGVAELEHESDRCLGILCNGIHRRFPATPRPSLDALKICTEKRSKWLRRLGGSNLKRKPHRLNVDKMNDSGQFVAHDGKAIFSNRDNLVALQLIAVSHNHPKRNWQPSDRGDEFFLRHLCPP